MSKTTNILLKILRGLLIVICIICSVAIIGSVGKLESAPDAMFAYYTKTIVWYCIGAVVSFLLAKASDFIIKTWG